MTRQLVNREMFGHIPTMQAAVKSEFVGVADLIIQVLSESTERMDRREKFFACTNIESLQEYVLVAQDGQEVTIFRRGKRWKAESVSGAKAPLKPESLCVKIPLAAIYEGV